MRAGRGKKSGFSLLELLIASALLMILTVPILGMFVTSTRISAASYKVTTATFMAQMMIEELIGLRKSEIEALAGAGAAGEGADVAIEQVQSNGFLISAQIRFGYDELDTLAEVTASVFDVDGVSLLCAHTAIIYIEGD